MPRPASSVRTPPKAALALVLAGGLLSACAAIPKLPPAETARTGESYAVERSFAAPPSEWPSDRWWSAYGDPQLDSLIDEALAGSPDLAAARARIVKAQALAGEARAATLPSLTGNASYQAVKQSYNNGIPAAFVPKGYNDAGRMTLDFAYDFDFFGKNRAALAAATSNAEAAGADAAAARLALSTSVASAYADLAQLFADRDAAQDAVSTRRQSLQLINDRLTNGLENREASEEARSNLASAQANLRAVEESLGLTRNRLAALLGAGPDRGLAIARPRVGGLKPFGLPTDVQADLIGRRPDVTAARLRAQAAAHGIREAKAEFYPDINLSAYFGQQSLGLDTFLKSSSVIGAIGPAVRLPIFDGGRLRANYRGAAADYDAAVDSYNGALTQALKDVADVAVSYRALDERLARSREAYDASRLAHEIALQRYRGGLATYLDVLTAENTMIVNQQVVADLQARAFTLDVALVHALGGGFHAA